MNIREQISQNVNMNSSPSQLKITDIRVANINGAPKHCPLIKVYTNQGIVGYGEVRDASSATYALMLKSRLIGENPCNVDKIFRRIKQFGGHSRQGGGVSGLEIAMWDLAERLEFIKKIHYLRHNSDGIENGRLEWVENDVSEKIISFARVSEKQRLFVAVNTSDEPVNAIFKTEIKMNVLMSRGAMVRECNVAFAPYGYIIAEY